MGVPGPGGIYSTEYNSPSDYNKLGPTADPLAARRATGARGLSTWRYHALVRRAKRWPGGLGGRNRSGDEGEVSGRYFGFWKVLKIDLQDQIFWERFRLDDLGFWEVHRKIF